MRLHDATVSGNCYKVRLLLAQLGLPYERVEVNVLTWEGRDELRRLSPAARVPLLELDDGRALAESNAILWHLAGGSADRAAERSRYLPEDPFDRSRVLQWMFFEQNQHEPSVAVLRYWEAIAGTPEALGDALEPLRERGRAALGVMDRHLGEHAFFAGERYTIADIALYAYTHVAPDGGFDLGPFAGIRSWLERVVAQPGHVTMTGEAPEQRGSGEGSAEPID